MSDESADPGFAELVAATNYSFLRGASHPAEMVAEAIALGMTGIGIADRNSVAGVVRAWAFLKELRVKNPGAVEGFRLVVGARLVFADGTPDIVAYPVSRHGWGRLTRLLSIGNLRTQKGSCILELGDLLDHCEDLLLIAMEGDEELLRTLKRQRPKSVWLAATMPLSGADTRRLAELQRLSAATNVPLLATNDAFYATSAQRPLHDIITCIREGVTLQKAGKRLRANGERHLKAPAEMKRLFAQSPKAIDASTKLLARINFDLEDLRYEYPHEPVPPGWKPFNYLHHLVKTAAEKRYGAPLKPKIRKMIGNELRLIRRRNYVYYFLTVYDLVRFARAQEPPILCQGRGSAANSIVCFLLGVTSVDPDEHKLLFSRFVSAERDEPPDIDVDFEHERREEVIQYIYDRYTRDRAAIAATVIHYRPRSTIREVGKALGLSEDVTARLADTSWGSWGDEVPVERLVEAGLNPHNGEIERLHRFVSELLKAPRHLSQHVGGFVLTEGRLDELVPIHNAAMEDRTFIEWDKNDIDALGLMKVDVLALGMLTCIRKCYDLMREHGLGDHTLELDIDSKDPAVYDMLCKGDSIGVFQVESRAQINMLPRLRPRKLYDLVVQVAIVRPGPIEGDMVHPYLRRRNGEEEVEYPSPAPPHDPNELKEVLGHTFGVPLFQEQAMNLAITAAGFTPEEANGLRRAMATFRNVGTIDNFRDKMVGGMVARGYKQDFAERCFKQIEGFGSYGFPESHAQSFARLVYVSSWIKHYHPAVFACGILNSQPMGFYAPAQLVRDARDHGVEVRAVDANASGWDNSLERRDDGSLALRLGFRQVDGFREEWAKAIADARATSAFTSVEELARRANLPSRALRLIADADACRSMGLDRRPALWDARRVRQGVLPLFGAAEANELGFEEDAQLPPTPMVEHVLTDYQTTRLSLKGHPMAFLRADLAREGILSATEVAAAKNGAIVRTAGVVLVRQRPGKGNAIFITLEDEGGIVNILLWARHFERYRRAVMASRLMLAEGEVQRSKEGVIHLMATRIVDRTAMLDALDSDRRFEPEVCRADEVKHPQVPRGRSEGDYAQRHGHPRNVRILPKSRDFH
ncbi:MULTISPECIES: error-prone DNA polymerase [unclassified Sphingopyxis]|uniref:error-prone DNA polymerase n=1 Tax=unclassified Sphingopyxis TaxID=2614943 RepID=UPI000730258A|nr:MULTISPECIES: error-prone DNA polymerase [unclassified Sphingopyxis]KTE23626.1 DNA polymerase [Sphingopyxis sp. H057]KTE50050.1 DNA polymerase [Sphingopyxis sp. H073]KTE53218.1 DNA polymerase [Sphingopyxis sp. H071]KTE59523.1 DNA polymerase [Sphingopyxis sp. H107]KTE63458.1 DNA polymerase [Sphingopyxis sp. H100]